MAAPVAAVIEAGDRPFAGAVLPELAATVRSLAAGSLVRVVGSAPELGRDLDLWCRFTRNTLLESEAGGPVPGWTIRCGALPAGAVADAADAARPVGARLWLYANFDCNLRCEYCCVRSSPRAERRPLGLERVRRIAREAMGLGVREVFLTGGEPFLLPDLGALAEACTALAPTTLLTNGMLFTGRRLDTLRALGALGVTLQISLDSPTPERHDRARGAGTWARAWSGVRTARAEGLRVRIAATVSTDAEEQGFRDFLDEHGVAAADRVVRRVALRGFAEEGVPLSRADLVPEVTITADGVYWHPVGARDADFLVTPDIFPLADAIAAVRHAFATERQHETRLAQIFNCA